MGLPIMRVKNLTGLFWSKAMRLECPFTTDECKQATPHSDVHHFYYPRKDYKTKTEKEFRNLPENKGYVCRCLHNFIHATQEPPVKPTLDFMLDAINRYKASQ